MRERAVWVSAEGDWPQRDSANGLLSEAAPDGTRWAQGLLYGDCSLAKGPSDGCNEGVEVRSAQIRVRYWHG